MLLLPATAIAAPTTDRDNLFREIPVPLGAAALEETHCGHASHVVEGTVVDATPTPLGGRRAEVVVLTVLKGGNLPARVTAWGVLGVGFPIPDVSVLDDPFGASEAVRAGTGTGTGTGTGSGAKGSGDVAEF